MNIIPEHHLPKAPSVVETTWLAPRPITCVILKHVPIHDLGIVALVPQFVRRYRYSDGRLVAQQICKDRSVSARSIKTGKEMTYQL